MAHRLRVIDIPQEVASHDAARAKTDALGTTGSVGAEAIPGEEALPSKPSEEEPIPEEISQDQGQVSIAEDALLIGSVADLPDGTHTTTSVGREKGAVILICALHQILYEAESIPYFTLIERDGTLLKLLYSLTGEPFKLAKGLRKALDEWLKGREFKEKSRWIIRQDPIFETPPLQRILTNKDYNDKFVIEKTTSLRQVGVPSMTDIPKWLSSTKYLSRLSIKPKYKIRGYANWSQETLHQKLFSKGPSIDVGFFQQFALPL